MEQGEILKQIGILRVVLVFSFVLLIMLVMVIILLKLFQKRKLQETIEKHKREEAFRKEQDLARIEIHENAMKNIAWELHDNIGQLLSVSRMQLNIIQYQLKEDYKDKLAETSELIRVALQEVRSLSKILNPEVVENIGLKKAIKIELERFERLKFLKTTFVVRGDEVYIDGKHQLIIFRIIQEFFSNTIKHAKAEHIKIALDYSDSHLTIHLADDGSGFDNEKVTKSSGLINMNSRAKMINATINIAATPGKGVSLQLVYPLS